MTKEGLTEGKPRQGNGLGRGSDVKGMEKKRERMSREWNRKETGVKGTALEREQGTSRERSG